MTESSLAVHEPGDEVALLPRDVNWAGILAEVGDIGEKYPHVQFTKVKTTAGKEITYIRVPQDAPKNGRPDSWSGDLLLCDAGIVFIKSDDSVDGYLKVDELEPDSMYEAVGKIVRESTDDSYDPMSIRLKTPSEGAVNSSNQAKAIDVVKIYEDGGESSQTCSDLFDTLQLLETAGRMDAS